jgi:hypothetical protein
MQKLEKLIDRIIRRVNMNLRGQEFDAGPFLKPCTPLKKLSEFYAFYAITGDHPLHFRFSGSNLAGSYFLGKCQVDGSSTFWKPTAPILTAEETRATPRKARTSLSTSSNPTPEACRKASIPRSTSTPDNLVSRLKSTVTKLSFRTK